MNKECGLSTLGYTSQELEQNKEIFLEEILNASVN